MKLTPQEKADRRASFRRMTLSGKAEYIFAYYKLPLVLILIGLIFVVTVAYHAATRKNELLYLGLINVSAGEELQEVLTDGFVEAVGADPRKNEVYAYYGLYISDDPSAENHQYSYASRMKMLAAMNAEKVDVVLMNRESYDLFSHGGYLADLEELLAAEAPALLREAEPLLSENEIVLEDNAEEVDLGTADEYRAVTEPSVNGMDISGVPRLCAAGFGEPVYLCVIANSPRTDAVVDYIRYILSDGQPDGRK